MTAIAVKLTYDSLLVSRASPSYSKGAREGIWGIVHIQHVPVKEFPNTNQIAKRTNVYRKSVINIIIRITEQEQLASTQS